MVDLLLIRAKSSPDPRYKRGLHSQKGASLIPPYSILYIANYARLHGFKVRLLDCFRPQYLHLSPQHIADIVLKESPCVVGISALTNQSLDALALADAVKYKSSIPVVLGGPHFTYQTEEALKHANAVILGEGEKTMVKLLKEGQDVFRGAIPGLPLSGDELDSIPFSRKEELEGTAFDPRYSKEFPIITSRGCPYKCLFCKDGVRTSKVCFHSVQYIVDWLEYIHDTYGYKKFFILDDVFVYSPERLENMIESLARKNLQFEFRCFLHSQTINPQILKLMRRVGIKSVQIGIETGNARILKLINKGTSIEKQISAVRLCKEHGFEVTGLFMLGNIGETKETIMDTIRFAKSLPTDTDWFSYAVPFPGTVFYNQVQQYGKIIEPDFGKWHNSKIVYLPNGISKNEMAHLMKKAQRVRLYKQIKYCLRTKVIAKIIKNLLYRLNILKYREKRKP